jgi:hypothetical protein
MAEEVGALRVSVRANAAEIQSDMGKVAAIVNSASARMLRSMASFQKGAGKAVDQIFNLRNAALGLAGGAFIAMAKRAVAFGDDIEDTAQQIGITNKALQELRYAAQLGGVSTESFDKSMMQFSKRLGEAQIESNETSAALNRLGISMAQIRGMSADQVLKLVADRLPSVSSGFQQSAIAAALLGREGVKMLPTLLQGSVGLGKLADEAHRMGLILDDETIKKASEANDIFDQLGTAMKVAGTKAGAELLPILKDLRTLMTSSDFQQGVKDFAENLGKVIKWIVENKEGVVAITAAFAGFRVLSAFGPWAGAAGAAVGYFGTILHGTNDDAQEFIKIIKLSREELKTLQAALETETDPQNIKAITAQIDDTKERIDAAGAQLLKFYNLLKDAPKVTVSQTAPVAPFFSEKVKEQIDDLNFKSDVLGGKFKALAEGFPEAARALKVFGTTAENTSTTVAGMPQQMQAWNDAMLANQAAKVIDGLKDSTKRFADEEMRLTQMLNAGLLTQEQYNAAVNKLKFPSLTQAIDDAGNLNKALDQFSTASLNSTADALTDIATGAKTGKEAFADLAKSIIRDLIAMTIKAALFRAVGGFLFGFSEGGPVGGGGISTFIFGRKDGGVVHAAGGGSIVGRGTSMSDSIPSMLSDGEYVVRSSQASKHGELLDAINSGAIDRGARSSAAPAEQRVLHVQGIRSRDYYRGDTLRAIMENMALAVNDGFKLKIV